jgi:hypothetical protein
MGNQPVDGLNWVECLESSMTHRPTARHFTGTSPTRAVLLGDALFPSLLADSDYAVVPGKARKRRRQP